MSKDKTNQKGITLIALVITIIVMLILVGVSVTVALNGGLFNTAKQATNRTQLELDKEQLLSAAIGAIGEDGKVDFTKLELPEGFTEDNGVYTSKSGNKFRITEYGSVIELTEGGSNQQPGDGNGAEGETPGDENPTNPSEPTEPENPSEPAKVTITPKKETYTVGEEVTIGEENFYVIADDADKVTLLAKYNLNTAGTAQSNAAFSETDCVFSSTNYWSSETEYPLNLNDYTIPEGVTSVITTAKTYGAAKGGTGRLMTTEEAFALETNHSGIIHGKSIDAADGALYYWLGSAYSTDSVWLVDGGSFSFLAGDPFSYDDDFGVRPVVEISKSNIS